MFEDLMKNLESNTSPEGGVFNFEVGPVAEHVRAVYGAVCDLRLMGNRYDQDSVVRESVGAGWADRTNVVAVATGVEIADGVGEEFINMTYGDKLGGLRAPVDAKAILRQVEELRQDAVDVVDEAEVQPESPTESVPEESNVTDFSEAQARKAREMSARNLMDQAYRDHQNVA